MTSPKRKLPKTYEARVRHGIVPAQLEALENGVLLHGEKEASAALFCRSPDEHVLQLAIAEGKYHQVRRMVAAAGNRVEQLHRYAIGDFTLDETLPEGHWRYLEADDLEKLGYPVRQPSSSEGTGP